MKNILISTIYCVVLLLSFTPIRTIGCTSWMVFSDLTKNNTHILHKNRDSIGRKISVAISPASSPRKWVALWSGGTNSGINSSGLAATMNSGEICIDPPNIKGKKTTAGIVNAILESCDSAEQAVLLLRKFISNGNYYHGKSGSIFFFLDSKEGYICEVTSKVCSAQRYDTGYVVRASNWRNPNMTKYVRSDIERYLKASAREYIAFTGLNKMLDEQGKISLPEIFNLSRHIQMPEKSPLKRSICGITTNSTASFEIDKQYPDILSTAYFTIGPPRHTVYVPIPVCVEKIPSIMKNQKWSVMAFNRLDKLKLDSPLPEEWLKFEQNSITLYSKAKDKARQLLKENKQKEAVKLLNFTAKKIWNEAAKVLKIRYN